jgi:hypothetical protein
VGVKIDETRGHDGTADVHDLRVRTTEIRAPRGDRAVGDE